MEQYDKIFDFISSQIESENNQNECKTVSTGTKLNDYCETCDNQMFLDLVSDKYICHSCGRCRKAYQEHHDYNTIQNCIFAPIENENRKKYWRLRRRLLIMEIDKKYLDIIQPIFDLIIKFFMTFGVKDRKNMIRYDYIVFRIFEYLNIQLSTNYKLKLTNQTISRYNEIWNEFCDYLNQINFIDKSDI